MTVRPNLVVLRVADLEVARAFYTALGLDLRSEQHGSGPAHFSHEAGGFVFELYPRRRPADSTVATRLGFEVPTLDAALLARLRDAGGVVVSEPARVEPSGRCAVVRDPDGHAIELREPSPPEATG